MTSRSVYERFIQYLHPVRAFPVLSVQQCYSKRGYILGRPLVPMSVRLGKYVNVNPTFSINLQLLMLFTRALFVFSLAFQRFYATIRTLFWGMMPLNEYNTVFRTLKKVSFEYPVINTVPSKTIRQIVAIIGIGIVLTIIDAGSTKLSIDERWVTNKINFLSVFCTS